MQGNPPEIAKTREKCGFSAVCGEGVVTLHQGMGGISGALAGKRVFAETRTHRRLVELNARQPLKRGMKDGP
jgi:hypothetical protein